MSHLVAGLPERGAQDATHRASRAAGAVLETRVMDVRRYELRVDGVLSERPELEQAVTLVAPADEATATGVLLCAYPGGGYGRRYYDVEWHGSREYSEAAHHASRGWIVACVDHLGVGESSPVDASVGLRALAAGDAVVAARIASGLRAGNLVSGLGPVRIDAVIGVGQSMGGALVTIAQAEHAPFDAVAILGSSAIHTVLPAPRREPPADFDRILRHAFHWDDVEPEIVAADLDGFPVRRSMPPWASATAPAEAIDLLRPGVVASEAAAIDVPVFLGCGARDVVPDPTREPAAYGASPAVSLHVLERMGHMHNFASTRAALWRQLHDWGSALTPRASRPGSPSRESGPPRS
jgi:pimeloyl-ACP methyl ester carboxylesterase